MPALPMPVFANDVGLYGFDSLTAHDWPQGNDGSAGVSHPNFMDLVNGPLTDPSVIPVRPATASGGVVSVTGARAVVIPNVSFHRATTAINSGVSGNRISDVLAAMNARIFAFNPDFIIGLGWINDVNGVFGAWDPATFTTNYTSFISQLFAWKPSIRFLQTSSCWVGEQYTVSPPKMGPNSGLHDPDIEQQSTIMAPIVQAAGGYWYDIRNGGLVGQEIINNPTNQPNGFLLKPTDGLHPSQLGARVLGALIAANAIQVNA